MGQVSPSKILLTVCLGIIVGVGIGSFVRLPWQVLLGMLWLAMLVVAFARQPKVRLAAWCVAAVAAGMLRFALAQPQRGSDDIASYHGTEVTVSGVISSEPDVRLDYANLFVTVGQGMSGVPLGIHGKMLVRVDVYPSYRYGDALVISCTPEQPQPVELEDGRVFAYDQYLARFGVYSLCRKARVHLVRHGQGNVAVSAMLSVKNRFVAAVQSVLPEPHASFLNGLLLGAKRSIPAWLMDAFSRTGTTHIVALSGYNITIIATAVMNVCTALWLRRQRAFWVAAGAIAFFIVVTGAQASVVRAGIMGMLVLVARQVGRVSRMSTALSLAAAAMVLINPLVLRFDTGFQLSFAATVGLVYLSPFVERLLRWLPDWLGMRSTLAATVSAIIMTSPLILYQFGRFSLVAPLVNVLILPAIPLAMGVGFVAGLFALVWQPLGMAVALAEWTVLQYVISVVRYASSLPFASWSLGVISVWWLVGAYLVLAGGIVVLHIRNRDSV